MSQVTAERVRYYSQPGPLTALPDAPPIQALLDGLPDDIPAVVAAIQNNLLHIHWAKHGYGVELTDARRAEVQIRTAEERLRRMHAAHPAPLTTPRSLDQKQVGNCRDFSVLFAALLRHKGIPARARCGFGSYFTPGHFEDHWVGEYWSAEQGRWIMVDAQLDAVQIGVLKPDFDTFDVPHDRFITGGHAWRMCRQEGANPDDFGIFDMHGLWFIRGNLARDVAALSKTELLPWDCWGIALDAQADTDPDKLAFLDRVAALSLAEDEESATELQALYETDDRLRVPPVIASFVGDPTPVQIALASLPGFDAERQPPPRSKAQVVALIRSEYDRLVAALAPLSEGDMLRPLAGGSWSVKDLLAHLTAWELRLLANYRAGRAGTLTRHGEVYLPEDDVERMNEGFHAQYRDLPLAEVRALFEKTYRDILDAIDGMSEHELLRPGFYAWTGEYTLAYYILVETYYHYPEHIAQLRGQSAG